MKRSIKSVAAVAVASLAAAALSLFAAPAANAATGSLTFTVTTGALDSTPAFNVPTCTTGANAIRAWLYGGPNNWPDNTALILARTAYTGQTTQGFGDSFLNVANANPGFTIAGNVDASGNQLAGTAGTPYSIRLECTQGLLNTVVDSYTANLNVRLAGSTAAATDTWTVVAPAAPASALSAPTVTPSTGVTTATSVTLSTQLTAPTLGAGVTATGSVQFKAGAANLGAPVSVSLTNAGTTVTQTASFPAAGSIPVTAVFTPAGTGVVAASTSAATTITVGTAPVISANTTTALTSSATTVDELGTVVLTATVANAGTPAGAVTGTPTGQVTFLKGTTTLGTGTLNASGVATLSVAGSTLAVGGPYSLTASYAAQGNFLASVSSAVSVTVTAASTLFNPQPSPQTIQTNVVGGTITVAGGVTAASGAVTLGFPGIVDGGVTKYALQLNASNTLLTNNGAAVAPGKNELYRIFVTDTRAGNAGYKVTGTVATDFSSASGDKIDSALLGWTPIVDAACATGATPVAPTFTAGTGPVGSGYESVISGGVYCSTATATKGAVVAPGTAGSVSGLKAGGTLFTTTAGSSVGTVSATADLLLNAPTTTKAGYYSTQLTLTALSN